MILVHGVEFSDEEIYWRGLQKWLLECGYRLRPRYQTDWTPSWQKSGKPSFLHEDAYFLVVRPYVDKYDLTHKNSVPSMDKSLTQFASKMVHPSH